MLAPGVNARETAACETPASLATSWAEGNATRFDMTRLQSEIPVAEEQSLHLATMARK
jgi:hypothetical protein